MDDPLSIALVQTSLSWEDPEANLRHFNGLLETINHANLVVLPEMFTTGFTMSPAGLADHSAQALEWMKRQARKLNSAITGSIIAGEENKFFNRLYFVTPEGDVYSYDKRHTFTLAGEDKVYARGKKKLILEYKGFKICPMICYDLRFPVWSRNTEDFDILIYVANWPATRVDAWDTLLKARAIENMVYCLGVNRVGSDQNDLKYVGHSAVYDCLGKRLAFSDRDEIIRLDIAKDHLVETREKLKFLQDRDSFNLQL